MPQKRLFTLLTELVDVEIVIVATLCDQFSVGALFQYASVLNDQDAVGATNGGKTVGDNKAGPALECGGDGFLNALFCLGVNR